MGEGVGGDYDRAVIFFLFLRLIPLSVIAGGRYEGGRRRMGGGGRREGYEGW